VNGAQESKQIEKRNKEMVVAAVSFNVVSSQQVW
jgi:hypothetical protein